MLVSFNALESVTNIQDSDFLMFRRANGNAKNNGQVKISWSAFKSELEAELDAIVGDLTVSGDLAVTGTSTFTGDVLTDAIGQGILASGIEVLDSIVFDDTIDVAGTANFRGNITATKEVNHIISVSTSTTAATAGGNLVISPGIGSTSGAGGLLSLQGAAGGATGTGGNIGITSGPGGGTSGNSGAIAILTSNETATDLSGLISVNTGTTASANSGLITIVTGAVATSGNSGAATLGSGVSTTAGNSGLVTVSTGTVGTGDSGNIALTTGGSTVGGTGDVLLTTGNTASGLAGDIILTTGTHTSATVEPIISMVNGVIRKPKSASVASGGTITGPQLVGGLITATGATGNWQLPTCAQITTAIGSTPAGTNFEFVFNAAAMTATNTATLVVGANMTVASAPAITGGGTLTCTQDTQVTAGFRIVYDTATTCKLYRIW